MFVTVAESVTCDHGHFSCGANSSCIHESMVCDGHPDCSSGLDESPATCKLHCISFCCEEQMKCTGYLLMFLWF